MIKNKELENLLLTYDMFHYEKRENIKVNVDINTDFVLVIIESKDNREYFKFLYDDEFNKKVLPLISLHFFALNKELRYRKSLLQDSGNIIFENDFESFIARDIKQDILNDIIRIKDCLFALRESKSYDSKYENYVKYNVAMFYAKYRKDFYDVSGKLNFFDEVSYRTYLEKENRSNDSEYENYIILDIARCLFALDDNNKLEIISEQYKDDYVVTRLLQNFKDAKFSSIYGSAVICAEYEYLNGNILADNKNLTLELISYINDNARLSFTDYFEGRKKFYKIFDNSELEKICDIILNGDMLSENKDESDLEVINNNENSKNGFKEIINNPLESEPELLFKDTEHELLAKAGEEQAKLIMEIINEKNAIKKDAEEFAKIILHKQKEYREIAKAGEEQARKIINLQKENEKLKALAEENAMNIFLRDKKMEEEMSLRDIKDATPILNSDIDKINNLLNALSSVKSLDFVINHPSIAQEVYVLEEKIVTYLSTHQNVKEEEQKEETYLTDNEKVKTPLELLSIIRNVYLASHDYEKDGYHTVINISPHFDKYRVVIYSVKDDNDDILTDVYFDKIFFNEDVIKEICEIYSKDATIVASKTDNIPDDLGDYLVLDNMDNALKFTGCKRYIIQIAKAYL